MEHAILTLALAAALSCGDNRSKTGADVLQSDSAPIAANKNSVTPILADTSTLAGQWYLQPVLPSDTATGKLPVISFDLRNAKFTGNTGCNQMSGTFKLTDTSLLFSQNIVTTKMACPGYNEDDFIKNLLRVNRYKFDNGVLILMFDQTDLSRWTRKPSKAPTTGKT